MARSQANIRPFSWPTNAKGGFEDGCDWGSQSRMAIAFPKTEASPFRTNVRSPASGASFSAGAFCLVSHNYVASGGSVGASTKCRAWPGGSHQRLTGGGASSSSSSSEASLAPMPLSAFVRGGLGCDVDMIGGAA